MPRQPEAEPRPAVSIEADPGGCLQLGLDGHRRGLVRDRGFRSVRRIAVGRSAGPAAGISWRRTSERLKTPGRTDRWRPGQTRAGRGGGTHAANLRRPIAGRLRLGLQQFHLHDRPIRFWRSPVPPSNWIAGVRLACEATRRSRFARHCSRSPCPTAATKVARLPRSSRGRLRVSVHRWPRRWPCRRNLARVGPAICRPTQPTRSKLWGIQSVLRPNSWSGKSSVERWRRSRSEDFERRYQSRNFEAPRQPLHGRLPRGSLRQLRRE